MLEQFSKFIKVARYGHGQEAASRSMFSRRLRRRVRDLTPCHYRTCIRKVAKIPNPNAKILTHTFSIQVGTSVQPVPHAHFQQKLKQQQRQHLVSHLRI